MQIPVEHLFTIEMNGLNDGCHDFVGPFGRRIFQKASEGSVVGKRFTGRVLPLHASDFGRSNTDGSIRQFEADVGLQAEDGTVVLMQFKGRSSPMYGPCRSRIQAMFEVEKGSHDWLNNYQAIGYGELRADGSTVYEMYGLIEGQPFDDAGAAGINLPSERTSVAADFVFRRRSQHVPGATRHVVLSPLGARYFTLAETGGRFEGPRIAGEFLPGYAWSPHHIVCEGLPGHPEFKIPLWHYNMRTLLRENDGTPILMSYTGASSSSYSAGSWMTTSLFEVPDGSHAWLNEIQAVGYGRWMGDGAEYNVYALR
jgi:hypothetical protein